MNRLTDKQIQIAVDKFAVMLRNMPIEDMDQDEVQLRLNENIVRFYEQLDEQNYLMRESQIRILTTQERGFVESFSDNPWADNYVMEIYRNQQIVRDRMADELRKSV